MKGRLRPANAVYPRHNAKGFDRNFESVWIVAWVGDPALTICAFFLITSAGVRMAQDTSSASEDALAWITGVGTRPLGWVVVDGLTRVRSAFVRS